ncbi:MAG: hypothetical protein H6579_10735 [Chitinophagales bacterium]|nr:hypothetical protein [Chitinophagales bacterium]
MKKLLTLLIISLLFYKGFTQTNHFKAEYKLLVEESSEEDDLGFLADNTISFCYSTDKSIVNAKAMGGMLQTWIIDDFDSDSAIMLYELIGNKYLIRYEKDASFNNSSSSYMELDSIVSFSYDESKKKTILGYSCYLALASLSNQKTAYFYVTEEVKSRFPNNNLEQLGLRGFPLEYYVISEGVTSGYTIKSFSEEEGACTYDASYFKEISPEEFSELMNSY